MKKLFLPLALWGMVFVSCTEDIFDDDINDVNKIWYTSTDGKIVKPNPPVQESTFGANIVSNTYSNRGVIEFDDEVTTIGNGAFYNCRRLTSIEIPNSVTSIGNHTFYGCSSLTSIEIPNSITSIGEAAFMNCSSLESVTIPDDVTTIQSQAFMNCSSLESVAISNGVTEIGYEAFRECNSLENVTIPDNVTAIQQEAFISCKKLESVTIGNGITEIGYLAFASCYNLKSVYCKATTPPTLAGVSEVFNGNSSDCKFYVPTESVSAYKNAESWRKYADAIVGYNFK